jgi:hypothetical protein
VIPQLSNAAIRAVSEEFRVLSEGRRASIQCQE